MTNLDRWKPLAQNVMSEMALPDDPVRLEVIERALAGAAKATLRDVKACVHSLDSIPGPNGEDCVRRVAVINRIQRLSNDGAHACATCKGERVVQTKPAGFSHADDLAEYEPCPDCESARKVGPDDET